LSGFQYEGRLGTAVLELTGDDTKLKHDISKAKKESEGALDKISGGMKKAGAGLTAGLTAPILAFGAKSIDVASDFEAQMNILDTAAGGAGVSLETLREAAIRTGADTELVGIDASQTADALTELYKAGFDTNDIFGDMQGYLEGTASLGGVLRSSVDLAAASELDLAKASEVVSVAMKTYGLGADEAIDITNNFVQAADASVASVPELADALVNVGPTAAAFGWTLNDTNNALAILSERGIKGSEAGTALKSMMTNIMRPTNKTQEALQELNVSLYDQEGHLKSLPEILGEFEVALGGVTEAQRNEYIQTLAGTYGMKAMNTLLAEGTEGWEGMEQKTRDASDAQATAAARTRGMKGAMEALEGAIETFMIQVGTPLIEEFVTPLIRKAGGLMERLVELDPSFIRTGTAIAAVLAVLGPLLVALGFMLPALAALVSPIGLIVAGIALLAAAFIRANGGIGPTIDLLIGVGTAIRDWFVGMWAKYGPKVIAIIHEVASFVQDQFDKIADWIAENMGLIKRVFDTVLPILERLWATAWQAISIIVTTAWRNIKAIIDAALDIILGLVKAVMLAITGDWEGAWNEIKAIGQRFLDLILQLLQNQLDLMRAFFGETWTAIREWWDEWTEDFDEKWARFWEGVGEFFVQVWEGIKEFFRDALDWIKDRWETWSADLKGAWETFWTGVRDFFREKWNEITRWVSDKLDEIWTKVQEIFRDIKEEIEAKLKETIRVITEKAGEIKDMLLQPYRDAKEALFGSGGILPTLLGRVRTWVGDVIGFFGEKLGAIRDAIKAPFAAARDLIDGIMTTIRDMFTLPRVEIEWTDGPFGLSIPKFSVEWFANGLDAIISGPTIIGVGEAGPERVTVTPLRGGAGSGPGRSGEYHLHYNAIRQEAGALDAEKAMRRLEWYARMVGA
jgi:TP901 family phage tail tape measure protein